MVDRFKIVEPDGREHGHGQDAAQAREPRCHGRRHAQQQECDQSQHLFAHQHDQGDHADGQKPRNFAHRVQPADFHPGKTRLLNHEVIEQRIPREKSHGHGKSHEEQKRFRTPPIRQIVGIRDLEIGHAACVTACELCG